jgi:hypothetical protein
MDELEMTVLGGVAACELRVSEPKTLERFVPGAFK